MRLEFLEPARWDMRDAISYLNDQEPGLGQGFAREVKAALSRIKDFPRLWTKVSARLRRCPLKRFPYSLFYHLVGERIIIVSVFHDRRNPEIWKKRERKL